MASVYKRATEKANRRTAWYFTYLDEFGKRRQRKGFTDKSATEKLAIKLEEEARMVREGIRESSPEGEQLKVQPQLEAYLKHLLQRDVSATQVVNLRLRIEKVIEGCEIRLVTDVEAQAVENYLAKRREDGTSKQTSNHYRQAMHQFCRWLMKRSLIKINPIAEIPKLNVETDRRHDRRPLGVDEFQRLIRAAETGNPVESIAGIDRAMMYILSAWTGYRRGEISSLTQASLELDQDPPHVTVAATYSKRRRKDAQVLHPEVVERLRAWLAVRVPTHETLLFPLTKPTSGFDRKTSKMMQRDLGVARKAWIAEADSDKERELREQSDFLQYRNDAGLFADFHANRHTFITNLARAGVSPKVTQTLARHSDIRLTMNVYTHTDMAERADAVAKLPSFQSPKPTASPVVDATTEDPKKPMVNANSGKSLQRHRSALVAEDDTLRHSVAKEGERERTTEPNFERRKCLPEKGLAEEVSGGQPETEIHLRGFEPLTFGSVDRCSIQLSYRCKLVARNIFTQSRQVGNG